MDNGEANPNQQKDKPQDKTQNNPLVYDVTDEDTDRDNQAPRAAVQAQQDAPIQERFDKYINLDGSEICVRCGKYYATKDSHICSACKQWYKKEPQRAFTRYVKAMKDQTQRAELEASLQEMASAIGQSCRARTLKSLQKLDTFNIPPPVKLPQKKFQFVKPVDEPPVVKPPTKRAKGVQRLTPDRSISAPNVRPVITSERFPNYNVNNTPTVETLTEHISKKIADAYELHIAALRKQNERQERRMNDFMKRQSERLEKVNQKLEQQTKPDRSKGSLEADKAAQAAEDLNLTPGGSRKRNVIEDDYDDNYYDNYMKGVDDDINQILSTEYDETKQPEAETDSESEEEELTTNSNSAMDTTQ